MWSDDDGPFEGPYHRLAETLCSPRPLSRPRPRLIVCGGGERKTLRLAAQYADESNVIVRSVADARHKLEVLRGHCAQLGRDPGEIAASVLYVGDALMRGDTERFVEEARAYAEVGVRTIVVMPLTEQPVAFIDRLGSDVVPAVAGL